MNGKEFVRWVRGEDEADFFNAFARVHAARESDLEEGARFVGAFRACGLAIPVWELVPGTEAEELTAPMRAMAERLDAAMAGIGSNSCGPALRSRYRVDGHELGMELHLLLATPANTETHDEVTS